MRVYCQNEGVRFCQFVWCLISQKKPWLMVLPSHMVSFVDWSCIWWKRSGHSIVVPSWHLLCHCFATERQFLQEYFNDKSLQAKKPIKNQSTMKYVSRVQRLWIPSYLDRYKTIVTSAARRSLLTFFFPKKTMSFIRFSVLKRSFDSYSVTKKLLLIVG